MRSFAPPRNIDPTLIQRRAIPTNNWWGNLIAHDKGSTIQPVWSNPYALQLVTDPALSGLAVSYPFRNRVVGGSSGNRNASRYYAHGLSRDVVFSAVEFAGLSPSIRVVDWADLGVTVEVRAQEGKAAGAGVMETTLVSGMTYVTAKYSGGLTPQIVSTAAISTVNGQEMTKSMNSITGSQFNIVFNNGERRISSQVANEQRILEHLKRDIAEAWSLPLGGSYYFNGKAAQKYASLCLLASLPEIVGDGEKTLLRSCLIKLRTVMAPFLTNTWTNRLQYDRIYGGIVSSEGFKKNDLGADFGNTMYNDHHFHYGYWLYTTAIINMLDPTWSELPRLNSMAKLLAHDVANFGDNDRVYPRFRSFDWFRGHSYSHGVTPFADGKDQESTSEDINFSFALYLLGKTTSDERMTTVGRLMTRVNAHAIRSYFLIDDDSTVHPSSFRPNKVTGIFFDNKVDYATWFSSEKHCIHGIQMIPVSPMTEFVRSKHFVEQEWNEVLSKTPIVVSTDTSNAWLSLLYTNYAQINKAQAMQPLKGLRLQLGPL
ncbi:hypothetical protein ATCC90586_006751 [Pythium insidiosum]|nr:hypothetical protein ATCC90586_006751 [Pythium insidiosum]